MQAIRESPARVVRIEPDASVRDAARAMKRAGVGCLVVVSDDRPVGILTDRDLCLRAIAPRVERTAPLRVRDVMTTPVECLPVDATVHAAVGLMRALGVRRLPLVDDQGSLQGLVALDDLLALLTGAMHDLAVEGLESRRRSASDGRESRARQELEMLYGQLVDGVRQARWTAQEAFLAEVEHLKDRAKALFAR